MQKGFVNELITGHEKKSALSVSKVGRCKCRESSFATTLATILATGKTLEKLYSRCEYFTSD